MRGYQGKVAKIPQCGRSGRRGHWQSVFIIRKIAKKIYCKKSGNKKPVFRFHSVISAATGVILELSRQYCFDHAAEPASSAALYYFNKPVLTYLFANVNAQDFQRPPN